MNGQEREARRVVVDFLDAWRYCPVSSSASAARQCLEKAADELLAALAAREAQPTITDEMVERAAKGSHEAERAQYIAAGEDAPTWEECLAEEDLWGGENFTLADVLSFSRAALETALGPAREEPYDPDQDKRPYNELTSTQQVARERASFLRQLDAVDKVLQWKGSGSGRVESIQRLLAAREEPPVGESAMRFRDALCVIADGGKGVDVSPMEFARKTLALAAREDTERPDGAKLRIALMERDWLLGAWAAMAGIPQAEAEAEMLVWTKKWRETAVRDTDQGHEPKIAPKTCACGHPLEAHMVFRTGPPHPCSECKCTTYTEQESER
jgi:hypothetical protein